MLSIQASIKDRKEILETYTQHYYITNCGKFLREDERYMKLISPTQLALYPITVNFKDTVADI